jgi:hypothetical protein
MKKIFSIFAAVLLAGSLMADNIYSIDFTSGQGEWTIDNKDLGGIDHVWALDTRFGMKASAYVDNTNHATESWLVSPAIDLSSVSASKLVFSHARKYGELSQLSVKAKAGDGDWATLQVSAWPDGSSWDFVEAEADLAALAGKAGLQIAFVYTSSTSAAATWEIKTVAVTDGGGVTPPEPEVTPAVPEGVLTCAAAKILAANAADPTADNKNVEVQANVKIRGFVTFAYDLKEGKQSAWIADLKSASAGEVQGYYLEVEEAVVKGDYVEIEGKFVKYFKAADNIVLEVTDGTMKKVEPLTGVENTVLTQKAQKVMIDGVVYIMRDNKLFNLQGAQVR